MSIWLGVTSTVCIGLLISVILGSLQHTPTSTDPAAFIIFLMPLGGYSLLMIPFKYETSRAKQLLAGIFQAPQP